MATAGELQRRARERERESKIFERKQGEAVKKFGPRTVTTTSTTLRRPTTTTTLPRNAPRRGPRRRDW